MYYTLENTKMITFQLQHPNINRRDVLDASREGNHLKLGAASWVVDFGKD